MGNSSDPNWLSKDWFRFHILRWLGSDKVQAMTLEQQGAYLAIMVYMYKSREPYMSVNRHVIEEFLNCSDQEYDRSVIVVLEKCFEQVSFRGKQAWYSAAIQEELMYKSGKSEKAGLSAKGIPSVNLNGQNPQRVEKRGKVLQNQSVNGYNYERTSERSYERNEKRTDERVEERVQKEVKTLPRLKTLMEQYEDDFGVKFGADNQPIKEISSVRPNERSYESLYSILFSFRKRGAGEKPFLDKSKIGLFPENSKFHTLGKFTDLETMVRLCQVVATFPDGDFLENLMDDLEQDEQVMVEMDGEDLLVDMADCGFRVVLRVLPLGQVTTDADDRLVIEVFAINPGIGEDYPGVAIVLPELDQEQEPAQSEKPKILPQQAKKSKSRAKEAGTYGEMAAEMIAAYPEKVAGSKWAKGLWLKKTTEHLQRLEVDDAADMRDKFVRWMSTQMAPWWEHWNETQDRRDLCDSRLQPPYWYITKGNWNLEVDKNEMSKNPRWEI